MAAPRPTTLPLFRLPEALWQRLEPLLPKVHRSPKGGRPPLPYRQVADGIYYVLRTGCHWKAAPPEFGSGSSLHRYFQRWSQRGVFRDFWCQALKEYDAQVGIDWQWQSLDGSMTKAPLGGKKDREKPDRSGQNRYQTFALDRWPRRAPGVGSGRRKPPGHEIG